MTHEPSAWERAYQERVSKMAENEAELITTMHRPKRVITTNDGEVMVPLEWVRDIVTVYDLTAETGLEQETREESDRYVQHVRTISQAVLSITSKLRPKA